MNTQVEGRQSKLRHGLKELLKNLEELDLCDHVNVGQLHFSDNIPVLAQTFIQSQQLEKRLSDGFKGDTDVDLEIILGSVTVGFGTTLLMDIPQINQHTFAQKSCKIATN